MPFHPQRIHYETSLFWDCLAPQIQKRLILVVVDHFVVGLVCWVTIISSISSQYRFVDSQWQPLPMMATGSHTNPHKMIQAIVTLHLHLLQSESHVLHIQTWSLYVLVHVYDSCISHITLNVGIKVKKKHYSSHHEFGLPMKFSWWDELLSNVLLKGMNLQTSKLNSKQWLIRWVMLPQGWVLLVVLKYWKNCMTYVHYFLYFMRQFCSLTVYWTHCLSAVEGLSWQG